MHGHQNGRYTKTEVYRSVSFAQLPSETSPYLRPQGQILNVQLSEHRRNRAISDAPLSQLITQAVVESTDKRGFDMLLDGNLVGPIKRMTITPFIMSSHHVCVPIRTFLPIVF